MRMSCDLDRGKYKAKHVSKKVARIARFLVSMGCVFSLSGCSDPKVINGSSQNSFERSCQILSNNLARPAGVSPRTIARFFHFAAVRPETVSIDRNFSPGMPVVFPSFRFSSPSDTVQTECLKAWPGQEHISGLSGHDVLVMGINSLMSVYSDDLAEIRRIRREMTKGDVKASDEYSRLHQAMQLYVPRVSSYRVISVNGKRSPTIVIEAANAVGRPIDAFLMTVHVQGEDGTVLGSGRIRFNTPVPLGIGQQSTYVVSLGGVSGIDKPEVVDYTGTIRVSIHLDDIIAEGSPILSHLETDPKDKLRIVSLGVYERDVFQARQSLASVRAMIELNLKK